MITIRKSKDRGHFDHGWLDTYHTFSFGDYYDPAHSGFRSLRVINEDRVQRGEGFPPHSHRDMEILTWVLEGSLQHKDSLGNGSAIKPGEIQRMSAGSGITHSEYNGSASGPVHLLQIWILPEKRNLEPGYEQKNFPASERMNRLCLLASGEKEGGAVLIHQDARLFNALLEKGGKVRHSFASGRSGWLQIARGSLLLANGATLQAGDGAAITDESGIELTAQAGSEILLFDLK